VRVWVASGCLWADVQDDGRGFDSQAALPGRDRNGLVGMRERAALLDGRVTVASTPGEGTVVRISVPLGDRAGAGERLRLLLVEDHAIVREAMAAAIEAEPDVRSVQQAGSLADARSMLDDVDVAVIDLLLPDGNGAELIEDLRRRSPDAQALIITARTDRLAVARAVERGAAGVLSKEAHLHDVMAAVRRLRRGESLMPLTEVVELLRHAGRRREQELDDRHALESLTPREREVLQLLADGLDTRESAARLHVSPRTHRNHVANILAKLGVHSQLQALLFALRYGVVEIGGEHKPT
jgi:DNA-binding NarL/FixJ family response regulator